TYFITTDHIGKPVLTLNRSRRITGVGEYEPFGALNRVEQWRGTAGWTYASGTGNTAFTVGQRGHGMMTAMRAHFTRFQSEQTCAGGFLDGIQITDNTTGTSCQNMSGYLGEVWSSWCPVVQNVSGYGVANVNWHTENCVNGTHCTTCPAPSTPYAGYTMRDYEYQRYQADAGAVMYFPPLRFPGQYFDEETHLHENWNRYYDPVAGGYASIEPELSSSLFVKSAASDAQTVLVYGYGLNNPLRFVDPTGLTAVKLQLNIFGEMKYGIFLSPSLGDPGVCSDKKGGGKDDKDKSKDKPKDKPSRPWWKEPIEPKATPPIEPLPKATPPPYPPFPKLPPGTKWK
ncbi:MAG: RHS repeat-associated core domain-containing protein, partial [Myxococcaceae bacterium]|nr:RHS repeat-associated core domain-containing protein [Myxococcaceae bacterium]